MCGIYGVVGHDIDEAALEALRELATVRGRDGGYQERQETRGGRVAIIGSTRATPTTEPETIERNPFPGIVFNGTIANDRELGVRPGGVDTEALQTLERDSLAGFRTSVGRIVGSFAIAALDTAKRGTVYLGCNYRPIYWYARRPDLFYFASTEAMLEPVLRWGHRAVKIRPYSVFDLWNGDSLELPMEERPVSLVLCSGGLDSTVAAMEAAKGQRVHLMVVDYGQRAFSAEFDAVAAIGLKMGWPVTRHELTRGNFSFRSSLVDRTMELARGSEAAEFAYEWVPGRNLLLLAYACAFAESEGFHRVIIGTNMEEAGAFPDNEPEFVDRFNDVLWNATRAGYRLSVEAPLSNLTKTEIVRRGIELQAPLDLTWSCHTQGTDRKPCGVCGSCWMRAEAFRRAGCADPAL